MKPLIILTGPTAVGKTALSISLAKAVGGEIISADSMQVYRHMDIGSAKIRPEEMDGVPHHLIDVLEPWEEFHVVRFQQLVISRRTERTAVTGKTWNGGLGRKAAKPCTGSWRRWIRKAQPRSIPTM